MSARHDCRSIFVVVLSAAAVTSFQQRHSRDVIERQAIARGPLHRHQQGQCVSVMASAIRTQRENRSQSLRQA